MRLLLWNLPIVLLVIITLDVNKADDSCPSFQAVNSSVAGDDVFTVNLTYVVTPCGEQKNSEIVLKTLRGKSTRSPPACIISINDTVCNSRVGCSCTSEPGRVFMVTMEVDSFDEEEWLIVGILNNQEIFRDNITLRCPVDGMQETSHSLPAEGDSSTGQRVASTTTDDPKIESTNPAQTPTTTPSPPQTVIYIMGGVIGFVLLVLTILAVFVGVLFWKRGRSRRLPPPPPAPHNFRRAVADVVMFHAQAAGLRDSDSFASAQGHEYDEIPDDTDLSKSDDSLPTLDSTAVSDSSMSDCLHHIACPSSNSSLPEDYLHPVESAGEQTATADTGTVAVASLPYMQPQVHGKMMVAAEPPHFRVDPPYENTVGI
ncbi:hypothetical protein V1264_024321 [Littorina saxatilis]|uniref:Uncharacterized protein n=1 Tax=Littorina saxatilis TaxID=31220 RepID=A0AAN9FY85_9CAEN